MSWLNGREWEYHSWAPSHHCSRWSRHLLVPSVHHIQRAIFSNLHVLPLLLCVARDESRCGMTQYWKHTVINFRYSTVEYCMVGGSTRTVATNQRDNIAPQTPYRTGTTYSTNGNSGVIENLSAYQTIYCGTVQYLEPYGNYRYDDCTVRYGNTVRYIISAATWWVA